MGISKGPGESDPNRLRTAQRRAEMVLFIGGLFLESVLHRHDKERRRDSQAPPTNRASHEII